MIPELKQYYIILGLMVFVSIGMQLILPFPIGFIVALVFCILLPMIARHKITQKYGKAGHFGGMEQGSKMSKICMACGKEGKGGTCSKCGSKMWKYR